MSRYQVKKCDDCRADIVRPASFTDGHWRRKRYCSGYCSRRSYRYRYRAKYGYWPNQRDRKLSQGFDIAAAMKNKLTASPVPSIIGLE